VRASRLRKALVAAQPRQAQVLSLSVARSERRALRHAHKPTANFSVTVHPVATRARSLKRSLPVRR
jgi:hypothetical protein